MAPKETRGEELVAILRRQAPDLEALFRQYGVSPDEAYGVLDQAVLEVQLRCHRAADMEGRLMRSVERGCVALLEDRRRDALEAPDRTPARKEARREAPSPRPDRRRD